MTSLRVGLRASTQFGKTLLIYSILGGVARGRVGEFCGNGICIWPRWQLAVGELLDDMRLDRTLELRRVTNVYLDSKTPLEVCAPDLSKMVARQRAPAGCF